MNAGIGLGLLTALLYGVSDFIARFSSRAVGVWRTLFWGELCSVSLLTAWIVLGGGAPAWVLSRPVSDWALAVASDLAILAATGVSYRALAIGRYGVIMPVVAAYGAVAALLSACLGEKLHPVALAGIAVAVLGGAMAAKPARSDPARSGVASPPAAGSGAGLAAVASILYGVGFCVQARFVVPRLGHLLPVWLYYGLGVTLLGGTGLVLRRDLSPPRIGQLPAVLGTGLDASSVLASLASVVTVVLARVLVKERVAAHQ